MNTWIVLLAAGSGSRLAAASGGAKKQFLDAGGSPVFWRSAQALARCAGVSGIVFVFPPDELDAAREAVDTLDASAPLGLDRRVVHGGARRQDSLENALSALPRECTHVLVHDAARCFVTPDVAARVLEALRSGAKAVIPAVPVKDTVKQVDAQGVVVATPERASLRAVQTPQGVELEALRAGFALARRENLTVTDDAGLVEALGLPVSVVEGSEANVKITTPEDLRLLAPARVPAALPRVGFGYDVHRYASEAEADAPNARPMVLGCAPIPGAPRVLAHSDGDVLLHALADALLGCLCLGDIGQHFPDTDPSLSGAASSVLVAEILARFAPAGLALVHVDLTVVAQVPKVGPHREHIRRNVAGLLGLAPERVNVKATTEEKLGFTGRKQGIKAYATATAVETGAPRAD
ncbi:Bifunctional enzyme IspD/IspF [Fundidesulfovibrio magnetotacticus]|uniref:Bifunctional enzyme IspD/IspF n=1 Tax=Fundidesulfovibrio magnetotacticus TaxID=2730080 RepID=A0A6V8LPK2_9BACT|nr:2-C-methyl-D-erythritol 4-phosphate cytidylyltransferase [Fundidesulfovibrio magnetotacticus]GFK94482.1 Bifunctional enzyme IspD/IspF [Fundidesulfovibrio magnetotacticus]